MMTPELLTPDHLQRAACVYIRQSSPFQVRNNLESQRLQYGLEDYARDLGFRDVRVVDGDLGITGSGIERPGFDRLVVAVGKGEVGLILATEASRLARNGRDWHGLLDFCAVVGCLVGDRDRLYDPGSMEDRMYLGMRGTFNEFELSLFRKRSLESRMAKAARGELFLHLPAGYDRVGRDVIEMSPDQRVRDAIRLVFDTFDELGSVRQTWLWFRNERVEIPVRTPARGLHWRVPTETSLHLILRNPIHAGAYAYGRRRRKTVIRDGRKQILRQPLQMNPEDWIVLLHDRHEGYISWQDYERNQALITSNRAGDRGAVRPGRALLAGLLRCGHCQRRIQVRDNGKSVGYLCSGATGPGGSCLSFGAVRVDEAVGQAVIEALQPLAVEAALQAMETAGAAERTTLALARSALSEARYKAERAKDQFDAVDPANHNVFHNLAAKWEACLVEVSRCEARVQDLEDVQPVVLTPQQRQAFRDLGHDLGRAWGHERATPELRKTVLRAVLVEITARLEDAHVHLLLHWKGGDHTELQVARMRHGEHRWTTDSGTVTLVRELARVIDDATIAALLNRLGKQTAKGNSWSKTRVRTLRASHGIAAYRRGEREERGELVLTEVAERFQVDPFHVRRLIQSGTLPARQACKGAPWIIAQEAIDAPDIRAILSQKASSELDPRQQSFDFQEYQ